jgi:hypothetical protein
METIRELAARLSGGNTNVMVVTVAPATPAPVDYSKLKLYEIAAIARKDMRVTGFSKKPSYAYVPEYLDALECLTSITDNYGADTGYSVVIYFIGRVAQWKGETARAIKAELNKRYKQR